jgi:hypothetical protein
VRHHISLPFERNLVLLALSIEIEGIGFSLNTGLARDS